MAISQICPKCGKSMVLRNGKYGAFYGCTGYPYCKSIVKYSPPQKTDNTVKPDYTGRNWSTYQNNIFEAVKSTSQNILISATAGSGKSTTLVQIGNILNTGNNIFLAFGKDIAKELGEKLPAGIQSRTTHSLALQNVRKSSRINVKIDKYLSIFNDYMKSHDDIADILKVEKSNILKCISLIRANMLDTSLESIQFISEKYNILFNSNTQVVINAITDIWNIGMADQYNIDFDDMIWRCAKSPNICEKFDHILLDESQDMNKMQLEFLHNSLKPNGRLIAVGDAAQSIFGFRGALSDSMDVIKDTFNCKVMPLSISYRCPASHVELVKSILPNANIEAAQNAIEGDIYSGKIDKYLQDFIDGGLALCRNNAPLIKPAFRLLAAGRKVIIKGKDIGIELIVLIEKISKRYHAETLASLAAAIDQYASEEGEKLIAVNQMRKLEVLQDKLDCITAFFDAESVKDIPSLVKLIDDIFSDDSTIGITFSSVHKAKGLESDNVYLINPGLMPSKKAKTEEDMRQEENIIFVAYTRSKKNLYLLDADDKK